jgi:hypothetical protein
MNARASASSSPSLSLSLPTRWSPSSFPVRSALRSALLVLGSTDVPSEVDGVVDGTCVLYACARRSDLNFDWGGLGGGPRERRVERDVLHAALLVTHHRVHLTTCLLVPFVIGLMRVRGHRARGICTYFIALLEIRERDLALVLDCVHVEFVVVRRVAFCGLVLAACIVA